MGQSLAKNLVHLIFSTKERRSLLDTAVREPFHAYASGIFKEQDSPCLAINSVSDHVHVLFCLNKNAALAQVIMQVKKGTSRWIKTQGPRYADFEWQNGYGAFSVSQSSVPDVRQYIENQIEHHRKVGFQEELRAFLKRHEMAYDERYIWE
jgi:REP element-mobilizing transposase RayT